MTRILLADYYGTCDKKGNPIGHSPKVLMEYGSMLKGRFDLDAALSPCLYRYADYNENYGKIFKKLNCLKYDIIEEGSYGIRKRIKDKFHLFANLRQVYHMAADSVYDAVFFYRTDFFLYLYMALHRKPAHTKMIVMVYQQSFTGGKLEGILQYFFRKGLKKADLLVCTNSNSTLPFAAIDSRCEGGSSGRFGSKLANACADNGERTETKEYGQQAFFMPDYTYDPALYNPYQHLPKREMAVCVGAMNPYKQLEQLVGVFNKTGYPLLIAGKFFDPQRAERLQERAGENITIRNVILSEDEYYRTIASAKYVVLPYDMNQYENRTSGVLQECLFLNCIPIAPARMLEQNDMPGIGYQNLDDLEVTDLYSDHSNLLKDYPERRRIREKSTIAEKLSEVIKDVISGNAGWIEKR